MKILTYLRSSLSDSNILACGEPGRYTQRGENQKEGQSGERRGAEDQTGDKNRAVSEQGPWQHRAKH